ncbi:dynamin family protein [Xanthobacter autotrophicus]|uniref:dynamin family protein n=1 Tax=Xanthobacter autotrophicus TaxID=280 RepID=UPI00372712E9
MTTDAVHKRHVHQPPSHEMPSHELRFMAEIDAAAFGEEEGLKIVLVRLEEWLASLSAALPAAVLGSAGLREGSALARQAEGVNAALRACMSAWPRQWEALQPARALAHSLDDKAVLLVFGKFNAGKSALCNFIADRFAEQGRAIAYFHLDRGRMVVIPKGFAEGATETTARLQGVILGDRLVLLDTPGLHSVTPENAALTRSFTDSADGVLWLTSSAAPGQVQELDELARELRRAKPLLPLVTRSDFYEEDEIDGALVKRLRNKSAATRAQQEADVAARAQHKLAAMGVDVAQLMAPVSISTHMARAQGATPAGIVEAGMAEAGMAEAGMEHLYAGLRTLLEPALAYRRRKPAEVLLHHLEENVLGGLLDQVLPMLAEFTAALETAREQLEEQHEQIADDVWRTTVPLLAGMIEDHAAGRDVNALCHRLSQVLRRSFEVAADEHLAGYRLDPDGHCPAIALGENLDFEDVVIDLDGDSPSVAVDYARLHATLEQQIRDWVLGSADATLEQCHSCIRQLTESAARIEAILRSREKALLDIRVAILGDCVFRAS